MIIWFCLIVPFLGNLIKRVLYHKETKWWEYLVDYGVTVPVILILKFTMSASLVSDTEYWGQYVTQSWYYQGWDEWVEDTCTRVVGQDEDGNDITEEYDCSYERDNEPYVEFILNSNARHRVASGGTGGFLEFGDSWARKRFPIHDDRAKEWGNEEFKDMRRDHNGTDGDAFVTLYKGDPETLYPWTDVHKYKNRTQVAKSMFDFSEIEEGDVEKYGLFDYAPVENHQQQLIQGPGGPTMGAAERRLQIANALLGKKKEVRMFILIYKNQPLEASLKQEGYWMGGNKNEFTLTIGVDDKQRVTWARVISWTDEKSLEVDLREYIGVNFINTGEKLDLIPIVNWMAKNIENRWKRKEFSEFNYITVEPPWYWVLISFLVVTLVNVGSSAWSVLNQFVGEEGSYRAAGRRMLHPHLPKRFRPSEEHDFYFKDD